MKNFDRRVFNPAWLGKQSRLAALRALAILWPVAGMAAAPNSTFAFAPQRGRSLAHRVLVVDDNPVNLMLATELLSYFNIQPIMAADGAEAVAMASELQLDMIFMDLQMPVLDGLTATRQIRAAELADRRLRVPVVAYTTSAPAMPVLHGWGLDGLLEKPCDIPALKSCLQRWCPSVLNA
jgi:CheY-like chemotaxis protein